MLSNSGINAISVAKRKLQTFSLTSPMRNDDEETGYDLEKRSSLDESDYLSSPISSNFSSRVTSASYEPMLAQQRTPSPGRKARAYSGYRKPWRSFSLCRCTPRVGSRVFTLALGAVLVIFMLSLFRMSWASARALGLRRPQSPPATWEQFPFLKRYHGGIKRLVPESMNVPEYPTKEEQSPKSKTEKIGEAAEPPGEAPEKEKEVMTKRMLLGENYQPYPIYDSEEYKSSHVAVQPCFLDREKSVIIPSVQAYNGVPEGMPDAVMGSYDLFGIRHDVCFERFGRLGPYGLGYSAKYGGTGAGTEGDREGADAVWAETDFVDYTNADWADAQVRCEEANQHRFKAKPKGTSHFFQSMAAGGPEMEPPMYRSGEISNDLNEAVEDDKAQTKLLPRTAVIIRTWQDYDYDQEDIIYLRSLIAELSLLSGAEYSVHFLVQVRDGDAQIWADEEVYSRVLNQSLPAEFRELGTLWSEPQMQLIYSGLGETNYRNLGVYGVYRSFWMPLMYFAQQHPEFDYFWNFEMDMRYTGHWYELLTKTSRWAAQQPRKGLWERNGRFYIPSEHGSWEDFSHMVRVQTEHGTASKSNIWAGLAKNPDVPEAVKQEAGPPKPEKPVWGPEPPLDDEIDHTHDQEPPTRMSEDHHSWGVGEEADLITFNPLFDPHGTNWILGEDVTGYNTSRQLPPRRVAINTFGRLSRRLVDVMWHTTVHERRSMFTEMFPASMCLQHGLKAVYAPHPVYIDRRWPTSYLASIFNGGRNGAAGGARLSVFSDERQHNFRGTTWYYDAGFAPNLWKRWFGYKVDNDGGELWETSEHGEGRMCLRSVLLHPVKHVDLVYEHEVVDE